VTATHRHGNKISNKDLDALANAQIEFKENNQIEKLEVQIENENKITNERYNLAIDQAYVLGMLNVSKSLDVASDELNRLINLGITPHGLLKRM